MVAVMFDTQKFVKRLQAAKFPPEQAEAQSDAMREVLETAFSSHAKELQDISNRAVESLDSKTEKALVVLKHDVNERFARTDAKIDKLEAKVDTRLAEMKGELILLKWMLGALVAGVVTLLVRTFTT